MFGLFFKTLHNLVSRAQGKYSDSKKGHIAVHPKPKPVMKDSAVSVYKKPPSADDIRVQREMEIMRKKQLGYPVREKSPPRSPRGRMRRRYDARPHPSNVRAAQLQSLALPDLRMALGRGRGIPIRGRAMPPVRGRGRGRGHRYVISLSSDEEDDGDEKSPALEPPQTQVAVHALIQVPPQLPDIPIQLPAAHPIVAAVQHPGYGIPLVAVPQLTFEQQAWQAFTQNLTHNHAVRRAIQQNRHRDFFQYNHHLDVIEAKSNTHVTFRQRQPSSRRGVFYEEVHLIKPHPATTLQKQSELDKLSKINDPLHFVLGAKSTLGSFIQMKSSPSTTHICIKKGVQKLALRRLAEHIKTQSTTHPSRLLIKRSVKGRYVYRSLVSSKKLKTMDVEELHTLLMGLIKRKTKYIQLQLKPNQRGGSLNSMSENQISML